MHSLPANNKRDPGGGLGAWKSRLQGGGLVASLKDLQEPWVRGVVSPPNHPGAWLHLELQEEGMLAE